LARNPVQKRRAQRPGAECRRQRKSPSLQWEYTFARPFHETKGMIAQHRLLSEVAVLADEGVFRTTAAHELGNINAEHLRNAHALIESGRSHGKVVLAGLRQSV
jgi:hypothetical protein